MVLHAADLLQGAAVGGEIGLILKKLLQRPVGDGQQLRDGIGGSALGGHIEGEGLVSHILIEAVADVLVPLAGGVVEQALQLLPGFVLGPEIGQQLGGALTQSALEGGGLGGEGFQGFIGLVPRLVRGEQVLGGPGVLGPDLAALGDAVLCHDGVPPYYIKI